MMARLSTKCDTAMENIDDMHGEVKEMKRNVKNLETRLAAGVRDEGIERKKIYDGLEARMVDVQERRKRKKKSL